MDSVPNECTARYPPPGIAAVRVFPVSVSNTLLALIDTVLVAEAWLAAGSSPAARASTTTGTTAALLQRMNTSR